MSQPIFALIDGNSFYASCQIAFNPALACRPVVVLSNNDGCIVAANQIAKNLNAELIAKIGHLGQGGYASARPKNMMFQPYFKVKWLLDKHHAAVFSSNYELYADMSSRMHNIVGTFGAQQEIYSIDESFLDLTAMPGSTSLTELALKIKETVNQHIGIPVAVGIGHSKTLAKLANHLAKKQPAFQGVLDLTSLSELTLNAYLAKVDIGNVWGIGRQLSQKLEEDRIINALALKEANPKRIRKKYGVVVERTLQELNGQSCLALETIQMPKKQIVSSRSFGHEVVHYEQMEQAVVSYISVAAAKLRKQKSQCKLVTVSIRTNPFKGAPFSASHTLPLIYESNNTILLAKMAKRALRKIWVNGLAYHKASVALSEISSTQALQEDLFSPNPIYSGNPKQTRLMNLMDTLNQTNGKGALFLASAGIEQKNSWKMNRKLMSNRYTTRWNELLEVI